MISSPFLIQETSSPQRKISFTELRSEFPQIFEDFQEELFDILIATGKVVGILEPDYP